MVVAKMCCLPGDKGSTTARGLDRRWSSSLSLKAFTGQGLAAEHTGLNAGIEE